MLPNTFVQNRYSDTCVMTIAAQKPYSKLLEMAKALFLKMETGKFEENNVYNPKFHVKVENY